MIAAGRKTTVLGPASAVTAPPAAPVLSTATTTGTLVPGTYSYRLVWQLSATAFTQAGPAATIVVPAGTNTNTVTIAAPANPPAGAFAYLVYGRLAGIEALIAQVALASPFTDTGALFPTTTGYSPAGAAVNVVNTTAGTPGTAVENAPGTTDAVIASTSHPGSVVPYSGKGRAQVPVS